MKLDDIEKLARAIEERRTGSLTFEATADLAHAVLAMLPVVRAAEAFADVGRSGHYSRPQWTAMCAAIDEMRKRMAP